MQTKQGLYIGNKIHFQYKEVSTYVKYFNYTNLENTEE